jgi:hypothetical protein
MNIIISYLGGSGGEILANPLINSKKYFSSISEHVLTDSGRMVPTFNQDFIDMFPLSPGKHCYHRDWTSDWQKLLDLKNKWLLLVTDPFQAQFLKSMIKNDVLVIGIVYNDLTHQFVLDSFCHKVLDSKNYLTRDEVGENFLKVAAKTPEQRNWFIELGKAQKLGEWYKTEYNNGNILWPPKSHSYGGDFVVDLSLLLKSNGLVEIYKNLSTVLGQTIDLEYVKNIHKKWLTNQQAYGGVVFDQQILVDSKSTQCYN